MASNVIVQVLGGQKQVKDGINYVRDARSQLGLGTQYKASVNGSPKDDSASLCDGDYVSFSEAVKGAQRVVGGIRI